LWFTGEATRLKKYRKTETPPPVRRRNRPDFQDHLCKSGGRKIAQPAVRTPRRCRFSASDRSGVVGSLAALRPAYRATCAVLSTEPSAGVSYWSSHRLPAPFSEHLNRACGTRNTCVCSTSFRPCGCAFRLSAGPSDLTGAIQRRRDQTT
jgi:hypothetical protein